MVDRFLEAITILSPFVLIDAMQDANGRFVPWLVGMAVLWALFGGRRRRGA